MKRKRCSRIKQIKLRKNSDSLPSKLLEKKRYYRYTFCLILHFLSCNKKLSHYYSFSLSIFSATIDFSRLLQLDRILLVRSLKSVGLVALLSTSLKWSLSRWRLSCTRLSIWTSSCSTLLGNDRSKTSPSPGFAESRYGTYQGWMSKRINFMIRCFSPPSHLQYWPSLRLDPSHCWPLPPSSRKNHLPRKKCPPRIGCWLRKSCRHRVSGSLLGAFKVQGCEV